MYNYKLTKLKGGSERYGFCEVCKKEADVTFYQVETKDYINHEGKPSITWADCFSYFGHKECLIKKRRK